MKAYCYKCHRWRHVDDLYEESTNGQRCSNCKSPLADSRARYRFDGRNGDGAYVFRLRDDWRPPGIYDGYLAPMWRIVDESKFWAAS